jgi:hypothetical protein
VLSRVHSVEGVVIMKGMRLKILVDLKISSPLNMKSNLWSSTCWYLPLIMTSTSRQMLFIYSILEFVCRWLNPGEFENKKQTPWPLVCK